MFKNTIPKLVKIRCPDCNIEETYIIEESKEVVCCYKCLKLVFIECKDMNRAIVTNSKDGENVVFGRRNAYSFLLQYFYKKYDEEVIILDFLNEVHKKNRAIENVIIDTVSRMLYVEKQLVFTDENYANNFKYLFGYTDGNVIEDKEKCSVTIDTDKKKILDDIFINKDFTNFYNRFY